MAMKDDEAYALVITLPADQIELLAELVDSGQYASRDEIVRDALRLWEERQSTDERRLVAWHKHEHQLGLASGLAADLSPDERLARFKADFGMHG
jgi:Arc/MetJ-type ribon-helix-helix transcriptional regulator